MTTVENLRPGDLVPLPLMSQGAATYIARTTHPLYPKLQLVIWRMSDGRWSHDALDRRQDVGKVEDSSAGNRAARLRAALIGGNP